MEYSESMSESDFDHAQPIFMLATERSGTNLLRQILDTHTRIAAPHPFEGSLRIATIDALDRSELYPKIRDSLITMYYSHHSLPISIDVSRVHQRLSHADDISVLTFQQAFYDEFATKAGSDHWMSKWSGNIERLEDICDHYEDPKFVHLVRDCRDNVLSKRNNEAGRFHPYFTAKRWQEEQAVITEFSRTSSHDVHHVKYEDLLDESEETVAAICEYLDVEYEPPMLHYYDDDTVVSEANRHHAFENLSSPIQSGNYGKFHEGLTEEQIRIVESIAAEYLDQYGYDLTTDESEREDVQFDVAAYERQDEAIYAKKRKEWWRERPRERARMLFRRMFQRYMSLRYS